MGHWRGRGVARAAPIEGRHAEHRAQRTDQLRGIQVCDGQDPKGPVAQQLGRRTIGIELQEQFIKLGLRRLGVVSEYNGEPLAPTPKNFARRSRPDQTGLFER